ncbi:MAG: radical SAM protein [candidate division KSB1 bacterium]|nr:radical SAM protein [candidate division KSB1 bacterium]
MSYATFEKREKLPNIPVRGTLTLTYRCNNDCRHCWVREAPGDPKKKEELSTEEWIDLIDQARAMGTREWSITGGEPMLRPDFLEIFQQATRQYRRYSLNTNGTFLTPKIAKQIAANPKGRIMVALYGATEDVNDHITRNPGSYQAALRGMRYLKEAGVKFEVQIVPMRDNIHQLEDMKALAETISPHWRLGAVWYYLHKDRDESKNKEIRAQRLPAEVVVELDNVAFSDQNKDSACQIQASGKNILQPCLEKINHFAIDPFGHLSFCDFIRKPELLYDLRKGTFKEGWERFIPSLNQVTADTDYTDNCGVCGRRSSCRWCPAYAWLETGSFSKPISYLCDIADMTSREKQKWQDEHIRYYSIGGLTVKLESELPVTDNTFASSIRTFETLPAPEDLYIRHSFNFPNMQRVDFGPRLQTRDVWDIRKKGETVYYLKYTDEQRNGHEPVRITASNDDHSRWFVYHRNDKEYKDGELESLSFAPNDQLILSNLVAHHQSTLVHASGFQVNDLGLLVPGQSGAGKSTFTKLFAEQADILSDDRVIIKKSGNRFQLYGTWKHSSIPAVSPGPSPLSMILFPVHDRENKLAPVKTMMDFYQQMLPKLVKPLPDEKWWQHTLSFLEKLYAAVPAYYVHFDLSGSIVPILLETESCV